MVKTPVTAFRIPPELLARVDAYASALSAEAGVPVSRAAAVVKLLNVALAQVGGAKAEPRKPRTRR
jgi:hypothetical protein